LDFEALTHLEKLWKKWHDLAAQDVPLLSHIVVECDQKLQIKNNSLSAG